MKKLARLIDFEKCDVETDEIKDVKCKILPKNKTLIKKVENCKPFIGISILFRRVSLICGGIIINFYLKLKKKFTLLMI